ncbi:MAG: methylmalonyl-CoA epimerase [Terriglobales bacterium]
MPLALDHLGIAVRDLDRACRFYAALGLVPAAREEIAHEQVQVVMLPLAAGRIELLQPTAPSSPVARFLERRGEGLHHIALQVSDLAATARCLREQGVHLVQEQIQTGAGGHRYLFVHPASSGGVLIELVES